MSTRCGQAGEAFSTAAWGDWHPRVPDGMVGLAFTSRPRHQLRARPRAGVPQPIDRAVGTEPFKP